MKFDKRFMRATELRAMGIPRDLIERIWAKPRQTVVFKIDPSKKNSPFLVDTEALSRFIERENRMEAAKRGIIEGRY